jgi:hypothetical protein
MYLHVDRCASFIDPITAPPPPTTMQIFLKTVTG